MPRGKRTQATIFGILPPYILRAIAERGSVSQRATALRTLATDSTMRALRASLELLPPATARRAPHDLTQAEPAPERTIYDAHSGQDLPGSVVRREGSRNSDDPAVNEAYDGLGATFRLFAEVYHRNSIDDEGLPLDASVHFAVGYDNAFWDGRRMVFGDGDGELFRRFTIAPDVIGHELTHGVTEDEARLAYLGQPGALNESISDVFGALVKQYDRRQTADAADWLIGAGLFTDRVKGVALRSMKAPGTAFDDPILGKDPQPAHMKDFVRTIEDHGGVHVNSGIPNHAFFLAAAALAGPAWERAGRVWYETLRDPRLRPGSGFRRFAGLTYLNAGRLFGQGGAEQRAIAGAWEKVGIAIPQATEALHAG